MKMKIRYKILIVIAIFVVFFFIRMPVATVCHVLTEDKDNCQPLFEFVFDTSPVMHGSEMVGSWTVTAKGMEYPSMPFILHGNVNAIALFFVLPMSIILVIYYKDKRK